MQLVRTCKIDPIRRVCQTKKEAPSERASDIEQASNQLHIRCTPARQHTKDRWSNASTPGQPAEGIVPR
jgi:hypothetical protein